MVNRPLYVIGIDGSTNTMGVAYGVIHQGILTVMETKLIDVRQAGAQQDVLVERHGLVAVRIASMRETLSEFIKDKHIDVVIYESHFLNPRRPTSVIPLVKSQWMVESFFMEIGISMELIPPQQMKKQIGVSVKGADKHDVFNAIQQLALDKAFLLGDEVEKLALLSEHEIDAIGIMYAKCKLEGVVE